MDGFTPYAATSHIDHPFQLLDLPLDFFGGSISAAYSRRKSRCRRTPSTAIARAESAAFLRRLAILRALRRDAARSNTLPVELASTACNSSAAVCNSSCSVLPSLRITSPYLTTSDADSNSTSESGVLIDRLDRLDGALVAGVAISLFLIPYFLSLMDIVSKTLNHNGLYFIGYRLTAFKLIADSLDTRDLSLIGKVFRGCYPVCVHSIGGCLGVHRFVTGGRTRAFGHYARCFVGRNQAGTRIKVNRGKRGLTYVPLTLASRQLRDSLNRHDETDSGPG